MSYVKFRSIKQDNVPNLIGCIKYNDVQEQLKEFERKYKATRDDWEQLRKVFDELIENFKYDYRTIDINDVIETATQLFEDICMKYNGTGIASTGGVTVKSDLITKQVLVNFELSLNQAFWDEREKQPTDNQQQKPDLN